MPPSTRHCYHPCRVRRRAKPNEVLRRPLPESLAPNPERDALCQTPKRRCKTLLSEFILELLGAERQIIRFEIRRRLAFEPFYLGELQVWLDRSDDALSESILQVEN